MSTSPIHPTISSFLLKLRKQPRKNIVRRMCDECLTGQHTRCESEKCTCKCNEVESRLAA